MKVKLSDVIDALDTQSNEIRFVYHIKKEQIFMLVEAFYDENEEFAELREDVAQHPDDYIELPDERDINEYGMMRDFILDLPEGRVQDRLLDAIRGKGAFRRFKNAVLDADLADRWYAWRDRELANIARDWCDSWNITIIED